MRTSLALLLLPLLASCGEEDLPGFLWQVSLSGAEDTCHDQLDDYTENLTYRLDFEGSYVELAIDADRFATGTISGCDIAYESVVWQQAIDGYTVHWQLTGSARYRQGGSSCSLGQGVDWFGTETFELVYSEHPDLETGCTYTLNVEGAYVGPAS